MKLKSLTFCRENHSLNDSSSDDALYYASYEKLCFSGVLKYSKTKARFLLAVKFNVVHLLKDFTSVRYFSTSPPVCVCGDNFWTFHVLEVCPRFESLRNDFKREFPVVNFLLESFDFSPVPSKFYFFLLELFIRVF